jgi:hypothetical protein
MARDNASKRRAEFPEDEQTRPANREPPATPAASIRTVAIALLILVVSGVVAFLLFGRGRTEQKRSIDRAALTVPWLDPDGQPPIVGALDVNPGDDSLWIASNSGLFRLAAGDDRPEQVTGRLSTSVGSGEISEQLTIRFRGPDHLVASGHPRAGSELPTVLGLIQSRDAGKTWTAISEVGDADFHAIQLSGSVLVAGLFGQPVIDFSRDGGRTFAARAAPEPIVDLEVDPQRPERWVASTLSGLFTSPDSGQAWRQREPVPHSRFAWPQSDRLYRIDPGGPVKQSADGGATWTDTGSTGGEPTALAAADTQHLYAVLLDRSIKVSLDGGRTWTSRVTP